MIREFSTLAMFAAAQAGAYDALHQQRQARLTAAELNSEGIKKITKSLFAIPVCYAVWVYACNAHTGSAKWVFPCNFTFEIQFPKASAGLPLLFARRMSFCALLYACSELGAGITKRVQTPHL